MDILIRILQLLLSLTILVTIHELGHYLAAKAFGARVDKFYIFFNPRFSLFKKKIGETEYGIGCRWAVIARSPAWWTNRWIPKHSRANPNLGNTAPNPPGNA